MRSTSSAPLAPDDQFHDRDAVAADFDGQRELHRQGFAKASDPPARFYRATIPPKPSLAKRTFRTLTRFVVAVLIGVGLTLGWQSYGDQATAIAKVWVPSLVWVLPEANAQAPSEAQVLPELTQQIKLIALDVAVVRRSMGQIATNQDRLAAKQDQMTQSIAALQDLQQDGRAKALSPAPRPVHPAPSDSLQIAPR